MATTKSKKSRARSRARVKPSTERTTRPAGPRGDSLQRFNPGAKQTGPAKKKKRRRSGATQTTRTTTTVVRKVKKNPSIPGPLGVIIGAVAGYAIPGIIGTQMVMRQNPNAVLAGRIAAAVCAAAGVLGARVVGEPIGAGLLGGAVAYVAGVPVTSAAARLLPAPAAKPAAMTGFESSPSIPMQGVYAPQLGAVYAPQQLGAYENDPHVPYMGAVTDPTTHTDLAPPWTARGPFG